MENGFSILMGIFSAALLLYAGLLALTKEYKMLPYRSRQSVQPKDPKRYTTQLAKVIALVALAPALCALVGLWNPLVAGIVLVVGAIVFIRIGTKLMRGVG